MLPSRLLALGLLSTSLFPLAAQTFPFQLRVRQQGNLLSVPNNATLNLLAGVVGKPVSATVTATYIGPTSARLSSTAQVIGSTSFKITSPSQFPLTLQPGDFFTFDIAYNPVDRFTALGQVSLPYVDASPTPGIPGNPGTINLNLSGTAPDLTVNYSLQVNGNVVPTATGGVIPFGLTPVNTIASATIFLLNRGSGAGSVESVTLTGGAFQLVSLPLLPNAIAPNGNLQFGVRYVPQKIGLDTGTLEVKFATETVTLTLQGSSTGSLFSYELLPEEGERFAIQPGQIVTVPDTDVGARTSYTVFVRNNGNAQGSVNVISISGVGYSLSDLPFLPAPLGPNEFLTLTLNFVPTTTGKATGRLRIGGDVFDITSNGLGSKLTYTYTISNTVSAIQSPGALLFTPLAVGQAATAVFRIRNEGTTAARITSVGIAGNSGPFRIDQLPALPLRLDPGASASFNITFAPATTGLNTAQLVVDTQTFTLSGFGTAPFSYTYTINSTVAAISSPGVLLFTPIAAGQSVTAAFQVRNESTTAVGITSIGIGGNPGPFRLDQLPALPLRLDPGASASFNVIFAPITTGLATAQLVVDTQTFTLSGFGNAPPPLPAYSFAGASGTQEPFQQPVFRLALADRYPLDLQGTLTINIDPDAFSVIDPAVQFSTGGRTVTFTIPANTTDAIFPTGQRDMRLQTGTVAGIITITPVFATASGTALIPANRGVLQITVPRRAPRLTNLQVTGITATGFSVQVTGYSSTRNLQNADILFTPATTVQLPASQFSVSVQNLAFAWYQSSTSVGVGSQFTLTLPFTFQRTSATTLRLSDEIQSVKVTLSNDVGTSNSLAVNLLNVNLP